MPARDISLRNRLVVNTRPRHQARELSQALQKHGASVLEFPVTDVVLAEFRTELENALRCSTESPLVVISSPNAVRALTAQVQSDTEWWRLVSSAPLAVIGKKTALQAERAGLRVTIVSEVSSSEGLADAILRGRSFSRAILLQAPDADPVLNERLLAAAVDVCQITAYRSVPALIDKQQLAALRAVLPGAVLPGHHDEKCVAHADLLTFASGNAARHFVSLVGAQLAECARNIPVAVIGPKTASEVAALGFAVQIVAKERTIESMVDSIVMAMGR